jgi:hypothetical protein
LQALDASSLSMATRVKGFAVCFGVGVLACLLGTIVLIISPLKLKVGTAGSNSLTVVEVMVVNVMEVLEWM